MPWCKMLLPNTIRNNVICYRPRLFETACLKGPGVTLESVLSMTILFCLRCLFIGLVFPCMKPALPVLCIPGIGSWPIRVTSSPLRLLINVPLRGIGSCTLKVGLGTTCLPGGCIKVLGTTKLSLRHGHLASACSGDSLTPAPFPHLAQVRPQATSISVVLEAVGVRGWKRGSECVKLG